MRKDFLIVLVVWLASIALAAGIDTWFRAEQFAPPSNSEPSAFEKLIAPVVGPVLFFVLFMIGTAVWIGPLVLILMLFIPKQGTAKKPPPAESLEYSN